MAKAKKQETRVLPFVVAVCALVFSGVFETVAANAQQMGGKVEQSVLSPGNSRKLASKSSVVDAVAGSHQPAEQAKSIPPRVGGKGPYYVDFRARTAASYGHAFVWFGKSNEKKVEVAGLHPAGDSTVPYILGHLMWVPSETGASYGDLDVEYLTASYRVYLSEADAKRVFAYIKHLQATSPVWNAQTTNCTAFIGRIATFMGLKVPFHLKRPEEYVNDLKNMNGGRRTVELSSRTVELSSEN